MEYGDKVRIIDYSSAAMIKNGEIVCSGGWSIYKEPQTAIVIATDCILPFGKDYENTHWPKNNTIIHIPSDGRTLFIRDEYLIIKNKYCECCGQKI